MQVVQHISWLVRNYTCPVYEQETFLQGEQTHGESKADLVLR